MIRSLRPLAAALLLLTVNCSLLTESKAQTPKTYTSSEILLGLKKLNVLGSVMYLAAHPDDENTRLIAYMANERLLETSYLSCTRGDGGQNLIGPELREGLGVIRTQELLAARRLDGGRQFFTRANDFGFSKTSDETFKIWDKEQVLADMVWVIRQRRPDVLITRFPPDARAGHGHHQASAILAAEAFDAAGDPKRFPEQLQYVQAWQPKRLLWNTGSFFVKPGENMDGYLRLDAGGYNPLLGQSYGEIAARSRSNHRSQGFGSAAQRGEALEYFQPVKGEKAGKDLFEGVDQTWNRVPGGAAVGKLIEEVIRKYDPSNPSASVAGLLKVRERINKLPNAFARVDATNYWVENKLGEINNLIYGALGLSIEANAAEQTAVVNGKFDLKIDVVNRAPFPIKLVGIHTQNVEQDSVLEKQSLAPPTSGNHLREGASIGFNANQDIKSGSSFSKTFKFPLLKGEQISQPYWLLEKGTVGMYKVPAIVVAERLTGDKHLTVMGGAIKQQEIIGSPKNPPAASVTVVLQVANENLAFDIPIQYKHTDPVLGELYQPLAVVPPVAVNLPAARAYVFADAQPKTVPVTLKAGRAGVAGTLALTLPAGWTSTPASQSFVLAAKDAEQTVEFRVQPGPAAAPGKTELRAVATVDGQAYSRGIQTIQYPHIPTQTLFPEAVAPLVKLDLRKRGQNVAYLMGAGDEVPEALRQVGYNVTLLKPEDLTAARLKQYDALVVGIRAYNTVDRLKTQQPEILKYIEQGGNVVVQYVVNRGTVLPEIGPYPMTLSTDRVTVEDAPVTLSKHPLLAAPNKITEQDFRGWVQEQGLYYPSKWDPKYQTVISSSDPGEPAKESAILVTDYGKGHYIYTGLSLFRELPAGVPGAYRIITNMISYGKEPAQ
ncbi:PIG-L family deacetylase [Microvirga sp. STS02]|uniref:PIG-L family deacetylase n=1 Tax=Hymenobacter negativus TaxID=2795026 RepID=UPI0018DD6DDE|nr:MULTISPECIES: PIG-L family deacetylase [Bacteria]MBH8569833.1 PIG-L family deacetylase [Hymenobacter negativus]MBR7209572.1 PIG-L family deacetylase [Microvirga sp. STS02]